MILGFADYDTQARRIATVLDQPYAQVAVHRFPDGESKVTVPADCGGEAVLVRSLDQPDAKLVELMLAAGALRDQGVARLTLVAPYLCYMRQDIAFKPGEAVSQRLVGRFLAGLFDAVVTVDPHLHRISTLPEAIPGIRAVALSAADAIGAFVAQRVEGALLLGPDSESEQWVSRAALAGGLDHGVCAKMRRGDRDVSVALPDVAMAGRRVVLVDDIASTGRTLAEATTACLAHGAASVDVAVTHALFAGDALQVLSRAGVREVWSTDAVAHPSNALELAGLLAESLAEALRG